MIYKKRHKFFTFLVIQVYKIDFLLDEKLEKDQKI